MQYIGKATEKDFNLRLNNQQKDLFKAYAIPASHHYALKDHIFNRDAFSSISKQIRKSALSGKTQKKLFKKLKNFWIMKLKTLKPKSVNQELHK